jgi:hypothetical protein
MRKDIKALNEAYLKATSSINEEVQSRTPNLDQIYNRYPHDKLIEVSHPSYLDVEDENAEPVDVLYVFLYTPASPGDYDTSSTSESLEFLGSFYNDEYVDINEYDEYEATAKAQQEIATGEDEAGYGDEDDETETDEQRLYRLYDEYEEALSVDDTARVREIGLEIAEISNKLDSEEAGSHESEEYGDEHNYV